MKACLRHSNHHSVFALLAPLQLVGLVQKVLHECEAPCKQYVLNPRSLSHTRLFGAYDKAKEEWVDGVFTMHLRTSASLSRVAGENWIVLDGPIDANWGENLNSLLDDRRMLSLFSGEFIRLPERTFIMFEAEDLLMW